jgi:hypothetical protein
VYIHSTISIAAEDRGKWVRVSETSEVKRWRVGRVGRVGRIENKREEVGK